MAEAMARSLAGDRLEVHSAGLTPTGRIAPPTLAVLQELGYSTEGLASKGLEDVPLERLEVIVSLIGEGGLRVVPSGIGSRRLSWSIRDPFGDAEAVYRAVARDLEARVRELVSDLLADE
jgi:protein-tyrosine-phosphatase